MHSANHLYRGQRVALLTQHGKEKVLALGCRVELVTGYDTDLPGTFSRDIPHAGTQRNGAPEGAHRHADFWIAGESNRRLDFTSIEKTK